MRKFVASTLCAAALALAGCGTRDIAPMESVDIQPVSSQPVTLPTYAVASKVRHYMSLNANVKLGTVEVPKFDGDFALAKVYLDEPANTDATYLVTKRTNGWWDVVLGPEKTITAEALRAAGAPESLVP